MKKNLPVIISFLLPIVGILVVFFYFRNICLKGELFIGSGEAAIIIYDILRTYIIFLILFIVLLILRLKIKKWRNVFTILIALWSVFSVFQSYNIAKKQKEYLSPFARYFQFSSYQEIKDLHYGESNVNNKVYLATDTTLQKDVWIIINPSTLDHSIEFFQKIVKSEQERIDKKEKGYHQTQYYMEGHLKALEGMKQLKHKSISRAFITYSKQDTNTIYIDDMYQDYPYNTPLQVDGVNYQNIEAKLRDEYDLYRMPEDKNITILLYVPQALDSTEYAYVKHNIINELKMYL